MQGFQQSLTSARVVSEAAVNFFDDIHLRSSRVMKILEESQNERFQQLTNFEKKFKVWKYWTTYTLISKVYYSEMRRKLTHFIQ